jgi:hypothetical protein
MHMQVRAPGRMALLRLKGDVSMRVARLSPMGYGRPRPAVRGHEQSFVRCGNRTLERLLRHCERSLTGRRAQCFIGP